jgi:hypothetical protein
VKPLVAVVAGLSLVAASGGGAAPTRTPLRLQVLGHANPGGGYSGDVFGHRGYAYLSSWRGGNCPALGVRVYNLRNPRAPKLVSSFGGQSPEPDVGGSWTEKTIVRHVDTPSFHGELAVTSFQRCSGIPEGVQGFGLYDVTNPVRPRRLALVRLDPRGSHEIWLQARGRRAYVYTAIPNSELDSSPDRVTPGEPDFRIFDVTNPALPVKVGEWGAWKTLGVNPQSGVGGFKATFVHSVITNPQATRAYLSYWDLGTVILDIRRPSAPRYLGRTHLLPSEQGDAHSAALGNKGRLLIETHETVEGYPTLWDVSNARRPKRLAAFRLPPTSAGSFFGGVHDPKVLGKRAYFSWYQRGVVVADISRPARPRLLAQFVPPSTFDVDGALCAGNCTRVWGVYATPTYVLASDMVSGLWVLKLPASS